MRGCPNATQSINVLYIIKALSRVYHLRHYGFVFGNLEVTAGDFITMSVGKAGSADWAVAAGGLIPEGLMKELGTSL